MISSELAPTTPARHSQLPKLGRLLWCEWFSISRFMLVALCFWLLAIWVIPHVGNPQWILLSGLCYALLAGPLLGGGDILDGTEEFTATLPPTRTERYFARLLLGLGSLLILSVMNSIAAGVDLPQLLGKLQHDASRIAPPSLFQAHVVPGVIFALPFTIFAFSFALAGATHSRTVVLTSWFWSLLVTLVLLYSGLQYEDHFLHELSGAFAFPFIVLTSGLALWAGHRAASRKEIEPGSGPLQLPPLWGLWVLGILASLGAAAFLAWLLAAQLPRLLGK